MESAVEVVEVRCPIGPRELFMKLRSTPGVESKMVDGNLMELSCRWCTRQHRRAEDTVVRVVHRFNFLGELVESEVQHGG